MEVATASMTKIYKCLDKYLDRGDLYVVVVVTSIPWVWLVSSGCGLNALAYMFELVVVTVHNRL